jgi:hypothetical protein
LIILKRASNFKFNRPPCPTKSFPPELLVGLAGGLEEKGWEMHVVLIYFEIQTCVEQFLLPVKEEYPGLPGGGG